MITLVSDVLLCFQICKLAFKVIHSTMILLPAWRKILNGLKLLQQNILCDVQTWWNSTYDMLEFVLKYHQAIDSIPQRQDLGLHTFELDLDEWKLAQQLQDVLKVCQT